MKWRQLAGLFVAGLVAIIVFRPGDEGSAGTDLAAPFGWIEHGLAGELLQVNNATGEIIERVSIAEPGDDFSAVSHGEGAIVWNRTTQELRLVDPVVAQVGEPLSLEIAPEQDPATVRIFGGKDFADDVIVKGDDRVVVIDPQTNDASPVFTDGSSESGLLDAEGRFIDLDPDAGEIRALTRDGLQPIGDLPPAVPGIPTRATVVQAADRLFTVDPARLAVREIWDGGSSATANCMTAPGELAVGSADGPGSVPRIVALDTDSSVLSVSEPIAADCWQVDLPDGPAEFGPPVVLEGVAYVPNYAQGRVEVVDLEERDVLRSISFATNPGQPFELEVFGRVVWANEPQGPLAGIVRPTGLTPIPKIESVLLRPSAGSEEGDGDSPFAIASNNASSDGQAIESDDAEAQIEGDGEPVEPGPQVVDTEVLGVTVEVDVEEEDVAVPVPAEEELLANFRVSSSTANVGDTVRFVDASVGSPVAWIWDFGDGGGGDGPEIDHVWETEGVYRVQLTVFDAAGNESSQATEITVISPDVALPPVADFTFDRSTIEEGESIVFLSRSTGEIDELVWDFGDGTTASGEEVVHRFDRAGRYTVTLTASNEVGTTAASVTINVVQAVVAPVASIGSVPTLIEVGDTLTFTSFSLNDPTTLRWDFGDGARASGTTVRHAWTSPGTYRVRLTASNTAGSDDAIVDIVVEPALDPPIARLAQSTSEVRVGDSIRFSSLSTNDPARLVWNFGDGSTARGTEVSHRWDQPGTYTVTLRAINAAGDDRVSTTVTILEPVVPPVAGFGLSTSDTGVGESIQFTDASFPAATEWLWEFGDGATSTSQNPSHAWASPGTYIVRLTAKNEGGQSSAQLPVTIFAEPVARFDWTSDGDRVSFSDRSNNRANAWRWDFGDGETSEQQNPSHRYDEPGEYTVTLVSANNVGESQPFTATVVVAEAPDARFSCRADAFRLRCDGSNSDGAAGFQWFAPDAIWSEGTSSSEVVFIFAEEGRYEVTLRVTNAANQSDERTKLTTRVAAGERPTIRDVEVEANRDGVVELVARVSKSPTAWTWNLPGAELIEGGNGNRVTYAFARNGEYTGTVSARNELGESNVFEFTVVVDDVRPQATFTWVESEEEGVIGFMATIRAVGTPSIDWDFDGGEIIGGTIDAPIVFFPENRRYDVTLTVTDENGSVILLDRVRWRG